MLYCGFHLVIHLLPVFNISLHWSRY